MEAAPRSEADAMATLECNPGYPRIDRQQVRPGCDHGVVIRPESRPGPGATGADFLSPQFNLPSPRFLYVQSAAVFLRSRSVATPLKR
jgi:hypothetical protein